MPNIIMSRPVIQKKGKTITRYSTASQRDCSRVFNITSYSIGIYCPFVPSCGNYSNNTVLDGGSPSTVGTCILDGGNPSQTSTVILVGGNA